MPRYVIFKTEGRWYTHERMRDFLISMGELDPTIAMREAGEASAGNVNDGSTWLAFKVKHGDVQAVVDAATYTFCEEPVPADEVTLDEHDVLVVNTKDECLSVLDDESFSQFIGVL